MTKNISKILKKTMLFFHEAKKKIKIFDEFLWIQRELTLIASSLGKHIAVEEKMLFYWSTYFQHSLWATRNSSLSSKCSYLFQAYEHIRCCNNLCERVMCSLKNENIFLCNFSRFSHFLEAFPPHHFQLVHFTNLVSILHAASRWVLAYV